MSAPLDIAVIGAGGAGLTAAWLLDRAHRVTVFEKNDYLGGHVRTIVLKDGPDAGAPVDTGFIVMNDRNYPTLTRMLDQLGVPLQNSDMAFGFTDENTGQCYSSDLWRGLFARRRNLVSPRFWRLVADILRFYRSGLRDLSRGLDAGLSLGEYLRRGGYSESFIRDHILPMGAAIWSTPPGQMMDFPAAGFLQFFRNHGLLELSNRPQWKTLVGGSHAYVKKIQAGFRGTFHARAAAASVKREPDGVTVRLENGEARRFDRVVIAAHADEALKLLADPDGAEQRLLGPWSYSRNDTVLHTDAAAMPPARDAWASWNYIRERGAPPDAPASLTYWMNRLQSLKTRGEYFVSLNRRQPIPAAARLAAFDDTHPMYTAASMDTQRELADLNGRRNTFFCGSYFSYGFHEDAVKSGAAVARQFGIEL
ncbi:MAG TPA: FAD-dependent oxidoreductase [Kiritimatiellia bacterium]|nr:FAD-dependent oxidoreductase [Kiritimatiellia bacterium]HRZ12064.1 FAD-dependent oxidoreductase [Kiritimatiellia bacterium]HSA19605.1 FAD-dependent oxidoreductase [Kiritimatiellia bacterium]